MTRLEEIIPELLAQNNCVIVPGFGGFIAKVNPAKVDYERGIMYPPYKSVLFNRQLKNDDGLLTHSLAQRNSESYQTTTIEIADQVAEWNKTMISGGRLEIDRLGVFYRSEDGSIRFEQDRHFNLLLASYGLSNVRFTPVVSEEKAERVVQHEPEVIQTAQLAEKEEEETKTSVVVEESAVETKVIDIQRKKRPVLRYAAASVLLPIAFYSFWIPVKTDVLQSGVISLNDFNPFYKKQKGSYLVNEESLPKLPNSGNEINLSEEIDQLPEELKVYSYKFSPDKFIQVHLGEQKQTAEDEKISVVGENSLNYIVGCFASKENADNLVLKLKENGLPAFIIDEHNGLHRVSAGAAFSEEKLSELQSEAEALGFKGWILK